MPKAINRAIEDAIAITDRRRGADGGMWFARLRRRRSNRVCREVSNDRYIQDDRCHRAFVRLADDACLAEWTGSRSVHGSRDGFGSLGEMEAALKLIPAKTKILPVQGAGHALSDKAGDLCEQVLAAFLQFMPR